MRDFHDAVCVRVFEGVLVIWSFPEDLVVMLP